MVFVFSCFYAAKFYNVPSKRSLYINGKIKAFGADSTERILENGGKDDKETREQPKRLHEQGIPLHSLYGTFAL
jgi:hypothetical protein